MRIFERNFMAILVAGVIAIGPTVAEAQGRGEPRPPGPPHANRPGAPPPPRDDAPRVPAHMLRQMIRLQVAHHMLLVEADDIESDEQKEQRRWEREESDDEVRLLAERRFALRRNLLAVQQQEFTHRVRQEMEKALAGIEEHKASAQPMMPELHARMMERARLHIEQIRDAAAVDYAALSKYLQANPFGPEEVPGSRERIERIEQELEALSARMERLQGELRRLRGEEPEVENPYWGEAPEPDLRSMRRWRHERPRGPSGEPSVPPPDPVGP